MQSLPKGNFAFKSGHKDVSTLEGTFGVCSSIASMLTLPLGVTCSLTEILHGRWLMGWLPIVNYTDAMGVAG